MYIFQFYREGGERSHANTRLINPALHIVRKNLLQTINDAFISDFNHVDGVSLSTATNTRARKKKKISTLSSHRIFLTPLSKRLRTEHHARAESWREGWRTREARRTKVEWPFAKLLDRKREIGCNPCAANRKCRTNISVPFLFPFPLSARVFLLSLPPSNFLGYTSPSPPPSLLSTLCSSEIIATPPIVSRWYTGLAQAQTRYLSVIRKASRSIKDVL